MSANPLYKSYQQTQGAQRPPANLNEMLQGMAQQLAPTGLSAEQMVRQMMQRGQMTQAQFEQLAKIADSWTGGRR